MPRLSPLKIVEPMPVKGFTVAWLDSMERELLRQVNAVRAARTELLRTEEQDKFEMILRAVREVMGVEASQILGPRGVERVADARHVAMFLQYSQTQHLSRTGRLFNRGHEAVFHCIRRIRSAHPHEPRLLEFLHRVETALGWELTVVPAPGAKL